MRGGAPGVLPPLHSPFFSFYRGWVGTRELLGGLCPHSPRGRALRPAPRGLLRDGYPVTKGFKADDVDPRREELENCFLISDKARCIAGSVLELVAAQLWK